MRFVNLWTRFLYFLFVWDLGNGFGFNAIGEKEATYLGMEIKKAANEFIGDGGIFDGARTFTDANLSPNNYEGEIQDISNIPRRAKQKGEPRTEEEQSEIRSELGGRARIAIPGALYDASVSAQTCETIDVEVINPIDFEEVGAVNVTKALEARPYSHMPGFEDTDRNPQRDCIV